MKLKCMAIWDKGAGAYLPCFFVRGVGEGVRHFTDAVNDGKSPMALHPEDFHLMLLGEFDDGTGVFSGDAEKIISALECVVEKG